MEKDMDSKEKNFNSKDMKRIFYLVTIVLVIALTILSFLIPIKYIQWNSFEKFDMVLYAIIVLIPLVIIAIFGTKSILRNFTKKKVALTYFYLALVCIYVFALIYVTWETGDYTRFLSKCMLIMKIIH